MKKITQYWMISLLCAGLPTMVMAQQQQITIEYEHTATAGNQQAARVQYNVTDGVLTTGIGFRLHFDSRQVEIGVIDSFHDDSNLGIQVMADTNDLDGNPATDTYINAAWADLSGNWPDTETFPATLYRVEYLSTQPHNKNVFGISVSATAVGFEFLSDVNLKGNKL